MVTIARLLPRKLLLRIVEMQEGRVAVYGHLVEQLRPFGLVDLQDDQTPVAMGQYLGNLVERNIYPALESELGIVMSKKDSATKDYKLVGETIGCRYDTAKDVPQIGPRLVVRQKYRRLAAELFEALSATSVDALSALVRHKFLERLAGLHGFICGYTRNGNALRNALNANLKTQRNARSDFRLVSKNGRVVSDVHAVLKAIDDDVLLPLVRSPFSLHTGEIFCAADASMSEDEKSGGFGGIAGDMYFFGEWPALDMDAIVKKFVSIAFLEFFAFLYAVFLMMRNKDRLHLPKLAPWTRVYGRSDNAAVCFISASRLATKPLMRLCLCITIFRELEEEFGISIQADHVAGDENFIPDALSRNELNRFEVEVGKVPGLKMPSKTDTCAVWDGWMSRSAGVIESMQEPEGDWRVIDLVALQEDLDDRDAELGKVALV